MRLAQYSWLAQQTNDIGLTKQVQCGTAPWASASPKIRIKSEGHKILCPSLFRISNLIPYVIPYVEILVVGRVAASRLDVQNNQKHHWDQNKQQTCYKSKLINFHESSPLSKFLKFFTDYHCASLHCRPLSQCYKLETSSCEQREADTSRHSRTQPKRPTQPCPWSHQPFLHQASS